MAIKIAIGVRKESKVFEKYNQPKVLGWLALLFPLGPIAYIYASIKLGVPLAVVVMAACYIPSIVIAKKCISNFETSGTDKTNAAKNIAIQSFGTALAGIIYLLIIVGFAVMTNAVV